MRVLDLFSGIGGFSLGLERAGMETVAFCEYEDHAQKIIKKHWPTVEVIKDVRDIREDTYAKRIDVITGGFPCQDLSVAGKTAGIEKGERSGLWKELHRLIGGIRPKYAIIENVSNLLVGEDGAWFAKLLRDLASIGYDAQWHVISVADVGGWHERERVWIISYPSQIGRALSQEIFNKISNKVRDSRTPISLVRLSSKIKQLQFKKDDKDHRKLDGLSDAVIEDSRKVLTAYTL